MLFPSSGSSEPLKRWYHTSTLHCVIRPQLEISKSVNHEGQVKFPQMLRRKAASMSAFTAT